MPLAHHYSIIVRLHVGCVIASGSLFTARGTMRLLSLPQANHAALRIVSYGIDSELLGAAVLLMLILHQYPIANNWLTVKFLLVFVYIGLGVIVLRQAQTEWGRRVAFAAALLTFGFIVGIALTRQPAGWLSWR